MVISGKAYTSDLIIFPDRIDPSWWRKSGHRLCVEDLKDVLQEDLEVLVVGTGYTGVMKVKKEVTQYTKSHGIELIIEKTKKAVERYNSIFSQKKTIGAFHLTC